MDILLINPPREVPQAADFPPMGLSYLNGALLKAGITSTVLDASPLSWSELGNRLAELKPQLVGIPCWTVERSQSYQTAKLVKVTLPQAKIIMGGHHATAFPRHLFQLASTDAVIIDEGEVSLVELARAYLSGGDLTHIKGIVYRQGEEIIENERAPFLEDLDSLPFPTHDVFNYDNYLGLPEVKGRAAAIISSRGCPYKCIYCSAAQFGKGKWRPRSPVNVVDELEWLYNDYDIKNFMFFDDNFTVKTDRAIAICQEILKRNLKINWVAESHVNHIKEELLHWMKESGCYRIDFGVESGSPTILKNIKKGMKRERIEESFRLCHAAGIKPRAYLMVGNPGESETTIAETAELMGKIKSYGRPAGQILWILPDTEIYQLAKSQGIIDDDFWLKNNSMIYYTGEQSVEKLKYLRDLLIKKLIEQDGRLLTRLKYLAQRLYNKFPFLQRLRKWRKLFGL